MTSGALHIPGKKWVDQNGEPMYISKIRPCLTVTSPPTQNHRKQSTIDLYCYSRIVWQISTAFRLEAVWSERIMYLLFVFEQRTEVRYDFNLIPGTAWLGNKRESRRQLGVCLARIVLKYIAIITESSWFGMTTPFFKLLWRRFRYGIP